MVSLLLARHSILLCLKIQTFSNLPIFHSVEIQIQIFHVVYSATTYSRGENKKKIVETFL